MTKERIKSIFQEAGLPVGDFERIYKEMVSAGVLDELDSIGSETAQELGLRIALEKIVNKGLYQTKKQAFTHTLMQMGVPVAVIEDLYEDLKDQMDGMSIEDVAVVAKMTIDKTLSKKPALKKLMDLNNSLKSKTWDQESFFKVCAEEGISRRWIDKLWEARPKNIVFDENALRMSCKELISHDPSVKEDDTAGIPDALMNQVRDILNNTN